MHRSERAAVCLVAWLPGEFGAGNRVRTGDLNLGKVALYQLSYSRAEDAIVRESDTGCKCCRSQPDAVRIGTCWPIGFAKS